ncbi:MAG: hypothetical protein ACFFFK_06660, partial [Candidatus Thorarchaeota archaeon]
MTSGQLEPLCSSRGYDEIPAVEVHFDSCGGRHGNAFHTFLWIIKCDFERAALKSNVIVVNIMTREDPLLLPVCQQC